MGAVEDAQIDVAWQAGRGAWPDVDVARERFATHVGGLDDAAARFGADLYLAAGSLANDAKALEHLERELAHSARGAIASIDANGAFIDEALQRLRTSLLVGDDGTPRLAAYAGRGPLRAWLGVAAARTALMLRRSRQRQREVPVESDDWSRALVSISTNDPELELLKRQYAEAFTGAFHDAVGALEPRLRTVLRMSFLEDLSIDEIGTTYAVHRATAARWIQRACDVLFEETQRLLAERLALTPTELARMTSLVRSQLDVSVSQLLPSRI
jgi:RNA polymerase sigma-70 factor (ECF subfamily)